MIKSKNLLPGISFLIFLTACGTSSNSSPKNEALTAQNCSATASHQFSSSRWSLVMNVLFKFNRAFAVDWGMSESTLEDLSFNATNQLLSQQILDNSRTQSSTPMPNPAGLNTLAPSSSTCQVLQKFVAQFPSDKKAEAENIFKQLMTGYSSVEEKLAIPHYDVAGALAVFLGASVQAYQNMTIDDPSFIALVNQLRNGILNTSDFQKMTLPQKSELYEELVVFGMLTWSIQEGLKNQPDAVMSQRLQNAAKNNIELFLNVSASRVFVTSKGLEVH